MIIKGIIDEDFVNYKKPAMVIEFPYCDFKCDKEYGKPICQNNSLEYHLFYKGKVRFALLTLPLSNLQVLYLLKFLLSMFHNLSAY